MANIIILGANGMLGTDLTEVLKMHHDVQAFDRDRIDITVAESMEQLVSQTPVDYIINCAAFTAVDLCETENKNANVINGYALKNIARVAKKLGSKIMHFSTDYVFDGQQKEGYNEDSPINPINAYGRSKALGEKILLEEYGEASYIIRTSWLYGKNGKNFVTTMLDLAQKGQPLKVVNDQIGSPTYSRDLAEAVQTMLEKNVAPGIYHLTNSGRCSWYEFAAEIMRLKKIEIEIQPINSDQLTRPAKRPNYSVLKNNKLPALRSWQEALQDFLTTMP